VALPEEFEKSGNWLFRRRSYLPLLMIIILVMGMSDSEYLGLGKQQDHLWEVVCLLISLSGLGIRAYTIGHTPGGTSGRNTREQVADTLNTSGIYSVVRHPLYLGNFFIWLGISSVPRLWWLTMICVLSFWIYYERIMFAEEAYLLRKFGKAFEEWADNTPAFIPDFRKWKSPSLSFSVKNVLKREYNGFLVIMCSMFLLDIVGYYFAEGRLEIDAGWEVLLLISFVIWMVLRTLKKKTMLLNVEGR
jgi:protein-S-isoprenylcysteine O-methyltransferase Ste14